MEVLSTQQPQQSQQPHTAAVLGAACGRTSALTERELQEIHARSSVSELLSARRAARRAAAAAAAATAAAATAAATAAPTAPAAAAPAAAKAAAADADCDDAAQAAAVVDEEDSVCADAAQTAGSDANDTKGFTCKRMKQNRDPQSHRVIEKRRRDRMNASLNDLSRLIPAAYLKQGQSRIEKAEIIELATQHIMTQNAELQRCRAELGEHYPSGESSCCAGKFYQGFRESSRAAVAHLTSSHGFSANDSLCCSLRTHLYTMSCKFLPADDNNNNEIRSSSVGSSSASQSDPAVCTIQSRDSNSITPPASTEETTVRKDPKSNFKCRFEAEAQLQLQQQQQEQQQQELRSRKRRSEGSETPDFAYRVRLLDRDTETGDMDRQHHNVDHMDEGEEDEEAADELFVDGGGEPLLPGFVLNSSGTHYEPVVIPPFALGTEHCSAANEKEAAVNGKLQKLMCPGVLHPVSIPVSFSTTRFIRYNACR